MRERADAADPQLQQRRRPLPPGHRIYYATCHPGLEAVVASELAGRAIGAADVQPGRAGVSFSGDAGVGYRANLWLRSAIRVLALQGETLLDARYPAGEEVRAPSGGLRWAGSAARRRALLGGVRLGPACQPASRCHAHLQLHHPAAQLACARTTPPHCLAPLPCLAAPPGVPRLPPAGRLARPAGARPVLLGGRPRLVLLQPVVIAGGQGWMLPLRAGGACGGGSSGECPGLGSSPSSAHASVEWCCGSCVSW